MKPKTRNPRLRQPACRQGRGFGGQAKPETPTQISGEGFTLVETIIALFLIVSALAGPFTLATRGIFSAKFSKNKLVALNLAQEGLEIIRQMRDTNILNGADWRGLGSCTAPCTVLANGDYNVDAIHDQPGVVLSQNISPLLFQDGFYDRQSGETRQPSFTRTVRVCSGGCADGEMQITSEVTWQEGGMQRRVTIEEKLYDWK
ncbi:MAG: hypothetical protein HYT42_01940 [Candidatus Sungbacteria bacterium]|nr:hypothetical protein [Candidatus Sungbacteria bacterium]